MSADDQDDYMKQLEDQRKAFEAQFGSLEELGFEDKTKNISESESEAAEEAEADGSSNESESDNEQEDTKEDDEEESIIPIKISSNQLSQNNNKTRKPKVIKFDGPSDTYIQPSKQEQKLIRSGKTLQENARKLALREAKLLHQKGKNKKSGEEKDEDGSGATEEENLHNDLQLQQFLKESHLLSVFNGGNKSSQQQSGVGLTLESLNGSGNNNDTIMYQDNEVMGKARMKTLEYRLRGLAETNGHAKRISKLEKVPMAVRKGMINKHMDRISKYEQDAKDGGIILSKVKKGQFRKIESTYKKDIERRIGTSIKSKDEERNARRERGLKVNSIGRSTRNGLVVSKEDIARINGSGNSRSGKKSFGGNKSKGFKKRGRGH